MKLEEYLTALEKCPDELVEPGRALQKVMDPDLYHHPFWRLTTELGVDYGWRIYLKADLKEVVEDFQKRDFTVRSWDFPNDYGKMFTRTCGMDYNPGTITLSISDNSYYPKMGSIVGVNPKVQEAERRLGRKKGDYNLELYLRYGQHSGKEIEDLPEVNGLICYPRALAIVIGKIGRYAIEKGIPLCFPDSSMGWTKLNDYSQMVFFP